MPLYYKVVSALHKRRSWAQAIIVSCRAIFFKLSVIKNIQHWLEYANAPVFAE